ncbi:MAG: hypothetical protein E7446_01795 [Ruminococcaceae bacterium]|nr:hypothetical protein [Oscillospiraceae bacterium]
MSYRYDGNGGFAQDQPPAPQKKDSDLGSWLLIGIMFMVAWPIGLFLLIKKLSQDGKQYTASAAKKGSTKTVKSKAAAVTRTPNDSSKGARILNIVGTVLAVAGGIVGWSILLDFGFYFGEYGDLMWFLEDLFVCLGLLSGGISLLLFGRGMKRRMRRFAKYLAAAGKRQSISITRLASAAEVSERRVVKDLDMMIERGMWGKEAYLDLGEGKLFRSAEAAEEQEPVQPVVPVEAEDGYSGMLRKIRRANDRIADETLSRQIDRLEEIAGRIFRLIEEAPEKKAKASTFLNYYLPTTQKLLDSYAEFEEAGVSGGNLSQAKRKIEQTMDNIVSGFERQLDELYRTDAMDIDSDIRVMETMLRRDGAYVEDDFGLGGAAVQSQEE